MVDHHWWFYWTGLTEPVGPGATNSVGPETTSSLLKQYRGVPIEKKPR